MTKTLTTEIHPDWGCWIAYVGNDPEDSGSIGEGKTREDAIADYWFHYHWPKPTARLIEPECDESRWMLNDSKTCFLFETREEAIEYAEAHQYLLQYGN